MGGWGGHCTGSPDGRGGRPPSQGAVRLEWPRQGHLPPEAGKALLTDHTTSRTQGGGIRDPGRRDNIEDSVTSIPVCGVGPVLSAPPSVRAPLCLARDALFGSQGAPLAQAGQTSSDASCTTREAAGRP